MNTLYIVVPCYHEEAVLPESVPVLLQKLRALTAAGTVSQDSRLLLVDDGSTDATWAILRQLYAAEPEVCALRLDCNRGHQNAVTAGMVVAADRADAAITIDADLQDDPEAIDAMVQAWQAGAEVVCGVRDRRDTDTVFKRGSARAFYTLVRLGGAKIIYDHADFRLMSRCAIARLTRFGTEDLFLRGLVTRLELPLTTVRYDRRARVAGESKYTLKKMLHLARRGFQSGRAKMADAPQIGDLHIAEALLQ